MLRDMLFSSLEVVSLEKIEHPCGGLLVLGHDPDEAAGLRIHGGEPHHLRVVLTKALGALQLHLLALQLLEDLRFLLLGVGEPGLAPGGDLKKRRLRDIDVALPDQGGAEAVQHGEDQGADLVAVHVGIGADDHLVPAEVIDIEGAEILDVLVLDLYAAAQHLHEIRDDIALEDPGIVRLQAVQDLASDRHDPLELRVPALLDRAQCGVALHDVDLLAAHVLGAAGHELLHTVGDIDGAGQILLGGDAGALRRFPAPLVHQYLLCDADGVVGVLDKIDLQVGLEELRHGLLDEFIGDGLLGLVLIAGLGGEVGAHQHQTVLDIAPGDLGLILVVLIILPQPAVDGADKSGTGGLLRTAAVLQEAGVVVVLHHSGLIGEAEGHRQLDLVLVLIRPVTAPALRLPKDRLRQGICPRKLPHIVLDAVLIEEILILELVGGDFVAEPEGHAGIDHRLTLHDIRKVLHRDIDIRKDLQIREPAGAGARLFPCEGGLLQLLALFAHRLALLEVELILEAVTPDGDIHMI